MSLVRSGFELQERDLGLLEDLFVSRVMTLSHASALHFDGRSEAAKKRVQKLKTERLIGELPRRARDPGVLFLLPDGYEILRDRGRLMPYPKVSRVALQKRSKVSELTLRHELEVMDVKAALLPAINNSPGFSVSEFTTWPLLHQFDVQPRGRAPLRVKPDGFIRVEEKGKGGEVYEHAFFVEVDRATETLDTLSEKAVCYREHYARGGYAESLGAPRDEFAEHPFRVLFVFPSEERRNNMAERLLALAQPIETQVWLTTRAALLAAPLGRIWLRPHDYPGSVNTTPRVMARARGYGRQAARDARIRAHIELRSLFSD
jgi:hypothetical protein